MGATYQLAIVHALLREGRYRVTATAATTARALGLDAIDMIDCVGGLTRADFHKTMPSERMAGLWQDVYRPTWCGVALYVKLQIVEHRASGGVLVIVSFKQR